MATFALMLWYIATFLSVCFLLRIPSFLSSRFRYGYLPLFGRDLTAADFRFVQKHVQIIDNQRPKIKPTLPLVARGWFIPVAAILWAFFALFLDIQGPAPAYILNVFDMTAGRQTETSFLVSHKSSVSWSVDIRDLLFAVTLLPGIFAIPALQAWAVKRNKDQAAFYFFTKRLYSDAEYEVDKNSRFGAPYGRTEALEKLLEKLLEKRILDPTKDYTFEELSEIITQTTFKPLRTSAIASAILVLSFFFIDAFRFVRISGEEISYSVPNSFVIETVNVTDVSKVTLYCKKRPPTKGFAVKPRRLILAVKLNNGFHFEVTGGNRHMGPILSDFNISSELISMAQEECKDTSKYSPYNSLRYMEPILE